MSSTAFPDTSGYASGRASGHSGRDVALIDLVDRLLAGGVVIGGDIVLAAADIDLVWIDLRALISSVPITGGAVPR